MDNATTMRRTYELINGGDIEGFGALLADGFVEHEELPGLSPGREGVQELFRAYGLAFPDLRMDVLDLVERLHTERGRTVVMVLHDLNLAARYAGRLVAMRDGRIVASGPPGDVLTADLLREVFELDAHVVADPVSGTPLVVPIGRRHRRAAPARGGRGVPPGRRTA